MALIFPAPAQIKNLLDPTANTDAATKHYVDSALTGGVDITVGNITASGNVTGTSANLGNAVVANYFIGNGSGLTSIAGSNIVGTVGNANYSMYAGTVLTNAQPNITSVGTLSNLSITGNLSSGNANLGNLVTANYFVGNGSLLTGIIGNATTANFANYAGNVTVASQPNITSVGTLTSLSVTGNITGGNANLGNLVTANYFVGNGSLLTSLTGANVTGFVPNANIANTAYSVSGSNVTGQVGNSLVASTVYTNAQPNITSLGTLTSLTVSGNTILTGNLTVSGNTTYVNSNVTYVEDPMIELGGGANGAALSSDDGMDRGTLLHYYASSTAINAFMGWKNANSEFVFASNASVTNNVATINTLGNIRAGNANLGNVVVANYFVGNGSLLTGIVGNATNASYANFANYAGNVTVASQPNITSVGTLSSLSVTGNITSGNANLGNLVTSNYFTGSGNLLSNIQGANVSGAVSFATTANAVAGANVSGQVGNALVAGTVYTNAQPNITSVGTLSSLSLGGTLSLPAISNLYIPGGSANYVIKTDGNGNLSFTSITSSGNANIAGSNTQIFFNNGNSNTLGTSANLTFNNSTNTLTTTNLVVSGTTNLGAIGNITITGGSSNQYLKTDGAGTVSFVSLPSTTVSVDSFTGDGSNASFTLATIPSSVNYVLAAVGGVMQPRASYSLSGNVLTFGSAPPNTSVVEVTTINSGVSVPSGGGGSGSGFTYSGISANTNLAKGTKYIVNTSSANLTLTLPSSASSTLGDEIGIIDGTGTAATHAITVTVSGGGNIMGNSSDMLVTTNRAAFTLVYYNSTQGWILTNV